MPATLPKEATFKDLRASRAASERFLRNVIGVMRKAQKEHGEVLVRVGTTGTGLEPNYRLEKPAGPPIFAVNGASHQRWPEGETFQETENWSTASMSYRDVEDLLSAITGYKRAE